MIDGSEDKEVPLEFVFFLIVGNQKKILIDTGSKNQVMLKRFGVTHPRTPQSLLNKLGVIHSEITDIIITHAHWDHIGSLSDFPNANVWIQAQELKHVNSLGLNEQNLFVHAYMYDDLMILRKLESNNKLITINGDEEILPCIRAHYSKNSHTPGSQFISVDTDKGVFVFAGDNAYLYENIEKNIPIGNTLSKANNLRSIKHMSSIATSRNMIIPGHEPKMFERFNCSLQHIACFN